MEDDKLNEDSENHGNDSLLQGKGHHQLFPVSPDASGVGLPYAPENFPNPGDNWSWRVGKRVATTGHYLDRYLYAPKSLRKLDKNKSRRIDFAFASKLSLERFIKAELPDTDIGTFFTSFSWKIPSKKIPPEKRVLDRCTSFAVAHKESPEPSSPEASAGCKAHNKTCISLVSESGQTTLPLMACDICCSEPKFCRDCCCILCSKTVDSSNGGYSFIRCEALAGEGNSICGHLAHLSCGLRAYMAGTVGGSIGLDTEYYCRRCDSKTDLVSHVMKLLEACKSIDSRNEVEKALNLGVSVLCGSRKTSAELLLKSIYYAISELKSMKSLAEIWRGYDSSGGMVTKGLAGGLQDPQVFTDTFAEELAERHRRRQEHQAKKAAEKAAAEAGVSVPASKKRKGKLPATQTYKRSKLRAHKKTRGISIREPTADHPANDNDEESSTTPVDLRSQPAGAEESVGRSIPRSPEHAPSASDAPVTPRSATQRPTTSPPPQPQCSSTTPRPTQEPMTGNREDSPQRQEDLGQGSSQSAPPTRYFTGQSSRDPAEGLLGVRDRVLRLSSPFHERTSQFEPFPLPDGTQLPAGPGFSRIEDALRLLQNTRGYGVVPEATTTLSHKEIAGRWATYVHQFLEGQSVLAYEWSEAKTDADSLREENRSLREQLANAQEAERAVADKLQAVTMHYESEKLGTTALKKSIEELRQDLKAREDQVSVANEASRFAERKMREAEEFTRKLEQLRREQERSCATHSSQNQELEAEVRKLQSDYIKALMNVALDLSEKDDSFHPSQCDSLAIISSLWDEKMGLHPPATTKDVPPPSTM